MTPIQYTLHLDTMIKLIIVLSNKWIFSNYIIMFVGKKEVSLNIISIIFTGKFIYFIF